MASDALDAVKFAPRRIHTALVLCALPLLGAFGTEILHLRADRISRIEQRLGKTEEDIVGLSGRVIGGEVETAAIKGSQARLENKVDALNDKFTDVQVKVNQILVLVKGMK